MVHSTGQDKNYCRHGKTNRLSNCKRIFKGKQHTTTSNEVVCLIKELDVKLRTVIVGLIVVHEYDIQ